MTTSQSASRSQLERDIAHALVSSMGPDHPDNDDLGRHEALQNCLAFLPSYSDGSLEALREAAPTRIGEELLHLLTVKRRSEQYIMDWLLINPYSGIGQWVEVHYVVRALPHYETLAPVSKRAQRNEQARAILRATDYFAAVKHGIEVIGDGEERYALISDEKLRTLLTTYESPSLVAEIIAGRGITDADQIMKLLDEMTESNNAIIEGTL